MKKVGFLILLACMHFGAFAQENQSIEVQYNANSLNPIPLYEQHYKVRVWRTLDLREKQNKGFFALNGEISRLIIDAVKSGEITDVYVSDSLIQKRSKAEFMEKLVAQAAETFPNWDPKLDYYEGDPVSYNGKNYRALRDTKGVAPGTEKAIDDWNPTSEGGGITYAMTDISLINIVEDMIFDRRRSRLYYDIQAFELIVPAERTETKLNISLGWFKYKDLEKVFRNNVSKAVWFNPQNTAQNKNFADAFLLRLHHASIYMVENADNETLRDVYIKNGRPYREAVWAREWEEMRLMEKEHNLWEF